MTDHATEAAKSGRIPVVFVELDMDICTHVYGTSPCTAAIGTTGTAKCYNTYATCQDKPHYTKGVKTYRFCEPSAALPIGLDAIPLLKPGGVSFAPQQITPGKGLGVRGSVTMRFIDAPWSDVDIDPYAADRAAPASGTFWGRFRARNPYYEGRPLRIISGYITQPFTWDAFQTRAYIIDSLSAIQKGDEAQITGKDILKLADDKKALFPRPSTGTLAAGITSSATTLTASPSGVGDAEYPASGKIAISGEIMAFTRSGDTFTVTRAQDNTAAAAHDADDTIQLVGEFSSAEIQDVIYDLLTDYAGIDTAYIDKPAWDTERDTYLTGVWNLTQPEPVGVNTLLSELTEQGNCRIWWDEIDQQIRFRAVRPLDAALPVLSDTDHFIQNTISVTEDTKQRISAVLVYFGRIRPTDRLDDPKSFAVRYLAADPDAAGVNQYGSQQIKKIFSRWFQSVSLGRVQDLADALLQTYRDPPRMLEFKLDAATDLRTGSIFRADTRFIQDVDGSHALMPFEVIESKEEQAGHLLAFKCQEMPKDIPLADTYTIIISTDTADVDLYGIFVSEFGVPGSAVTVSVTINSGVLVYATSPSGYALTNPSSWPAGTVITLTNHGVISGYAGKGGAGAIVTMGSTVNGQPGEDGGNALLAAYAITIDNTDGVIGAGGGGGGGGGVIVIVGVGATAAGGGGGGGAGGGSGGAAGSYLGTPATAGSSATNTTGGAGGNGTSGSGSRGGAGGDLNQNGENGHDSSYGVSYGTGGAHGDYAVQGNSHITWIDTGTILGAVT